EQQAVAGGAGTETRLELAAGRAEQVEPLLERDPDDPPARERLDGVGDARERDPHRLHPLTDVRLIDHEHRGAEPRVEVRRRRADRRGPPRPRRRLSAPARRIARASARATPPRPLARALRPAQSSSRSIRSGAETPIKPRRIARTVFAAWLSHSRAWVSSSSS